MKGGLTSMILAIQELSKNKNLKYQPVLLLTSDEEANNFAGIKYFLKKKESRNNIALAICGEPTDFEIKTNFYGALYMIMKFSGKSGHGAHSEKLDNAIINSAPFLNKLINYQKKVCKIYDNKFGYSTMNIGIMRGGEKVNQIPYYCDIEFAIRTVKNNKIYEKLFNDMMKVKSSNKCKIKKVFSYDPISILTENEIINTLNKILFKKGITQKNKFPSIKEFTEATFLNKAGIKTIVFGPGNSSLSHSFSEQIKISDVLLYKEILKKLFSSNE
jgi:acetylornithine deacetylase